MSVDALRGCLVCKRKWWETNNPIHYKVFVLGHTKKITIRYFVTSLKSIAFPSLPLRSFSRWLPAISLLLLYRSQQDKGSIIQIDCRELHLWLQIWILHSKGHQILNQCCLLCCCLCLM